mmetsp:Transcript_38176/g.109224  ORF Transcript_38176/g.109224 Transcript_38176/m.109224 type:complete len:335 (-) Transcript_38176:117-1121(-)
MRTPRPLTPGAANPVGEQVRQAMRRDSAVPGQQVARRLPALRQDLPIRTVAHQEERLVKVEPATPVVVPDRHVVERRHPVGRALRVHGGPRLDQGLADGLQGVAAHGGARPEVHHGVPFGVAAAHVGARVQQQHDDVRAVGLDHRAEDHVRAALGALVHVDAALQHLLHDCDVPTGHRIEQHLGRTAAGDPAGAADGPAACEVLVLVVALVVVALLVAPRGGRRVPAGRQELVVLLPRAAHGPRWAARWRVAAEAAAVGPLLRLPAAARRRLPAPALRRKLRARRLPGRAQLRACQQLVRVGQAQLPRRPRHGLAGLLRPTTALRSRHERFGHL